MDNGKVFGYKSSIEEILNKNSDKDAIFKDYISKKTIAEWIFNELHGRLRDNNRVKVESIKKGFILEDGTEAIGILSQCQSLQTLVSLASDFGLDFEEDNIITGQVGTIRQIMDAVIEDVIDRVQVKKPNGEVGYIFDASPYDTEHYTEEYSNIDAITWVVTSFFLILKYHATIGEVCKWEKEMISIIRYGLTYINDAFIDGTQKEESDGETKAVKAKNGGLATGWNFTKNCAEPSLYFTFTVCECYLDMYTTFETLLEYLHAKKNKEKYGVEMKAEIEAKFKKNEEEYMRDYYKEVKFPDAKHTPDNEMARLFRLINDIADLDELRIENTLYGDLEKNCKQTAIKVWSFVRDKLADSFFYNDLKKTVTEEEILMSTTSDVLFNTVYIVNIMICAGLDERILLEQQSAEVKGDLPKAKERQLEYNNLLESCLLAVQKAFRTYEKLKNAGKDYIVDQFLVGFNEDFDGHKVAINELRKLRMRIFSLLPLLIHTNNVASEYLVKYPHYNMKKYLEYILDNRYTKDGKSHWIWEADGFFCGSNYYYVLALKEYFAYYEEYEQKFIKIEQDNRVRVREIEEKHLEELKKPEHLIGQQEAQINKMIEEKELLEKEKNEEIEALQQKIDSIKTPVESAVREVVQQEINQKFDEFFVNFASLLADTFEHTTDVLTADSVNSTQDTNGVYQSVSDNLRKMIITAMIKPFADSVNRNLTSAEKYTEFKGKVEKDLDDIVMAYLGDIKDTYQGGSNLLSVVDGNK